MFGRSKFQSDILIQWSPHSIAIIITDGPTIQFESRTWSTFDHLILRQKSLLRRMRLVFEFVVVSFWIFIFQADSKSKKKKLSSHWLWFLYYFGFCEKLVQNSFAKMILTRSCRLQSLLLKYTKFYAKRNFQYRMEVIEKNLKKGKIKHNGMVKNATQQHHSNSTGYLKKSFENKLD